MSGQHRNSKFSRVYLFGIPIDPLPFFMVVEKIIKATQGKILYHVVTINPEFLMYSRRSPVFRQILTEANLSTPDGYGLRLAAAYLNYKITWIPFVREVQAIIQGGVVAFRALLNRDSFREIPQQVTGSNLVPAIAEKLAQRKGSLYLVDRLGGLSPDTVKRAASILLKQYPGLKVVGAECASPSDPELIKRINAARPDCLLVSFGFPEQEAFIYKNKVRLKAKVAIGVGGAFDYLAGIRRRPPKIIQGKFEWLWRLIPVNLSLSDYGRRLKRILTAFPLFPLTILAWKIRWGAGLNPIKAVVFDFGGVMNKNGVEEALKGAWRLFPFLQWPALGFFYFSFIPDLERGKIKEDLVWEKFLSSFGTKRELARLRSKIIDGYVPNEPLWNLVKKIRRQKKLKLAMLTNNIEEWMKIWEDRFRLSAYFDPLISSSTVGMRKPNPAIFRYLIRTTGFKPPEIIFIDDHFRNVIQARRLGIKAIRCKDPLKTSQVLEEITCISS